MSLGFGVMAMYRKCQLTILLQRGAHLVGGSSFRECSFELSVRCRAALRSAGASHEAIFSSAMSRALRTKLDSKNPLPFIFQ
jgi:hypothetical protein